MDTNPSPEEKQLISDVKDALNVLDKIQGVLTEATRMIKESYPDLKDPYYSPSGVYRCEYVSGVIKLQEIVELIGSLKS